MNGKINKIVLNKQRSYLLCSELWDAKHLGIFNLLLACVISWLVIN